MTYATIQRRGERSGERAGPVPMHAELQRRITELAAFPAWLRATLAGLSEDVLRRRPGPAAGEFSPHEHAWHLRDIEVLGYARRLAGILAEEQPFLPDLDGTRLALDRRYLELPLAQACEELARARAESVARLRRLPQAAFARRGELEGRGCLTLAELLEAWLDHDRGHRQELAALLAGPDPQR